MLNTRLMIKKGGFLEVGFGLSLSALTVVVGVARDLSKSVSLGRYRKKNVVKKKKRKKKKQRMNDKI